MDSDLSRKIALSRQLIENSEAVMAESKKLVEESHKMLKESQRVLQKTKCITFLGFGFLPAHLDKIPREPDLSVKKA